jgi:hypothetical protein
LNVHQLNSGGSVLLNSNGGNFTLTSAEGWVRKSVTFTAIANVTQIRPMVMHPGLATAGHQFYTDGWLLEQSATLGSYFDGSKDGFWTGDPHTSTSRNATAISAEIIAEAAADLAIEQAEELFPHPFVFTGSLGVQR